MRYTESRTRGTLRKHFNCRLCPHVVWRQTKSRDSTSLECCPFGFFLGRDFGFKLYREELPFWVAVSVLIKNIF